MGVGGAQSHLRNGAPAHGKGDSALFFFFFNEYLLVSVTLINIGIFLILT